MASDPEKGEHTITSIVCYLHTYTYCGFKQQLKGFQLIQIDYH